MKEKKDKGLVRFMVPLVLGNMLNPLNSTMLATAIVTICGAFGKDLGSGALLIIPLYFTSAIGQPLMGRLADLFSARRVNTAGYLLILVSALIGIYALNFNWLIVSRVLLGLGTSAAYPSSIKLIRQRFDAQQMETPGAVLGAIAVAGQASMALGPFLGGLLTQQFGWKGIFFINIPLTLIALVLSAIEKSGSRQPGTDPLSFRKKWQLLDPTGILLFGTCLLLFLHAMLYHGGLPVKIVLGIVLLIIFVKWEMKHSSPFIDVRLLQSNILLNTTFIRQVAVTFVLYTVLYGMPQWMEQSLRIAPSTVGLIMLPQSLAAIGMSLLVAKSKKIVSLLTIGTISITLASSGLFLLSAASPTGSIIVVSILIGIALGILTIANQGTLYQEAPPDKTGVSFGLYRTVSYFGAIISGTALKSQYSTGATDPAFHILARYAVIACGIIVIFLLPTLRLNRVKKKTITI